MAPRDVMLPEFGLRLGPEHLYFLHALTEARLLREAGANFRCDEDNRLRCEVGGITVFVRSLEEMWILLEIFVQGIYDVRVNGPAVVWDIGMNVGLASLYFAVQGNTRVVGYEPIGATYDLALENLVLNPSLRALITAVNRGVGGSGRTEMVEYCDAGRNASGYRRWSARQRLHIRDEIIVGDRYAVLDGIERTVCSQQPLCNRAHESCTLSIAEQ